jgi:N-methylhydantoinase A/oxoprolinase/acetone carboxylase beta subunit
MTDAYLLLGLFDPDSYFGGSLKLDVERARAAVTEKVATPLGVSLDAALLRMEQAYVSRIAEPMAALVTDPKSATLLAFGGAGPMSACRIAEVLGVREVVVPRMAAVFSAFGIGFSDIAHSYQGALAGTAVESLLERFLGAAQRDMYAEGFDLSECRLEKAISYEHGGASATLRFNGGAPPPVPAQASGARLQVLAAKPIPHFTLHAHDTAARSEAKAGRKRRLRLAGADGGLHDAELPLYRHDELKAGDHGLGPAVIEEEYFTCLVPQGWRFLVNDNRDLVLNQTTK